MGVIDIIRRNIFIFALTSPNGFKMITLILSTTDDIKISALQQNDTILTRIADASVLTASNTTLGTFDWMSFFIAVVALLVSFLSLYYAIVTLKVSKNALLSQERTELNTRRISNNTQEYLLSELMVNIFDNYAKVWALDIYLTSINYTAYPGLDFRNDLKISTSYIQDNVDINDNNELYLKLMILKERVSNHNDSLRSYLDILSDNDSSVQYRISICFSISRLLEELAENVGEIVSYYPSMYDKVIPRIIYQHASCLDDVKEYRNSPYFLNNVNNRSFLLNLFRSGTFVYNKRNLEIEELNVQMLRVVSYHLQHIPSECYSFDIPKDDCPNILSTIHGFLLPVPSINKRDMFCLAENKLYYTENALCLFTKQSSISPTLSYTSCNGDGKLKDVTLSFNRNHISSLYTLTIDDDLLNDLLMSFDDIILQLHTNTDNIPSIIEMSDNNNLYIYKIPKRELELLVLLSRRNLNKIQEIGIAMKEFKDKYKFN